MGEGAKEPQGPRLLRSLWDLRLEPLTLEDQVRADCGFPPQEPLLRLARRHNTHTSQPSRGERRRAPTMPDLSSRNKVPFVSLSHFNGLAGTQRLGLPSRPKAARNSLAKLVMDTRVAFSYLLAGRGLVCPAGASRCGPIHNAGEGEACAQGIRLVEKRKVGNKIWPDFSKHMAGSFTISL
ncbi:uncharacterized protein LOC111096631 isoform X8 [Canis lupus familiaris]|uniref:uncharacterized protein LOC111096631 isoform X8 n=1 Tax=Canis lupus familiaris TaxID=9615 RepID=UPI000BAA2C88|nr:uncharacterized protein LOC111096631 isoform X8 [Canis lupus familiaris]XP_038398105.1 uncharacterized protein LOC111096631 isoform X6 [Canis lupus familiaris]|eukprot:XP_022276620.1 uncharacterized protein LOC111096631 isoform X2 [Canis lupus familiaris]